MSSTKIILQSSDNVLYKVNIDVAKQSILLKGLFEEFQNMELTDEIIPVFDVRSEILKKIIEYIEYHHNNLPTKIIKPLICSDLKIILSKWEYSYIDVEDSIIFELILASNYLNIPSLTDLLSAKIATFMLNKSAQEIRTRFNLKSDLTDEEVQNIHKEIKYFM